MITTYHVRHIFMPVNQTIKNEFISHNNLLNVTIQSYPIKRDCCNTIKKHLMVATINPISHSHSVHHGTFFNVLVHTFVGCKCREIIIFAHKYLRNKTQTKHPFVLNYNRIYYSQKGD